VFARNLPGQEVKVCSADDSAIAATGRAVATKRCDASDVSRGSTETPRCD